MAGNCLGFEYLPHSVVRFSAEWVDKRGAVFAVGDPQKYSVCSARSHDRDSVVPIGKNGQDISMDVAGGRIELFVLYPCRVVLTGIVDDRHVDAAENLYVYLDDRHVFESLQRPSAEYPTVT